MLDDQASIDPLPPTGDDPIEDEEQEEENETAGSPDAALPALLTSLPARKPLSGVATGFGGGGGGGGKRKKSGCFSKKRLAGIEEKLALLRQSFHPSHFSPSKTLDFSSHERLLRAIGLWDFAQLDFTRDPLRPELIVLLIANYDPSIRGSRVNGTRIGVSRADLARALGFPVKKDKNEIGDAEKELFAAESSVGFVMDFMSSWMLFQDDAWILPKEVVLANQMIKEGNPHKVDWAGLMWSLVEKELMEAPKSGHCYYASHIQFLMRNQKPKLFIEEAEPNAAGEPEQEPEEILAEAAPAEEDDDANEGVVAGKVIVDEFLDSSNEGHCPGLSLGLGGDIDGIEGIEGCKREEEEDQSMQKGKGAGMEHCLRRCDSSVMMSMQCDNLEKDGGEGVVKEERFEDDLTEKFSSLERMASTDLLQAMDAVNVSYSQPTHSLDPSTGDFLAMSTDGHKEMAIDPSMGGSLLFGNDYKRAIGGMDDGRDDGGDDGHQFAHAHQQKRMRTTGPWEQTSSPFDACMEQAQYWISKAKMVHEEKEQACSSAQLELQYLNDILQQKDQIIQSMEKARIEDQQKREMEIGRFEHELRVISRLVLGYKKALKDTRTAFAEYRKRSLLKHEPLYRDVPESGGLVLSTRELERQRIEKEEETRLRIAEIIDDFQKNWLTKLTDYADKLMKLAPRFVQLDEEFRSLREKFTASKGSNQ